jgi:D-tyrosyl-tRNA(Tyr) deacylase
MKSQAALEMYNEFLDMLRSDYEPTKIKDGVFGAMMDVALVNDGPVTIIIESSPSPLTASSLVQQGDVTNLMTGDNGDTGNSKLDF